MERVVQRREAIDQSVSISGHRPRQNMLPKSIDALQGAAGQDEVRPRGDVDQQKLRMTHFGRLEPETSFGTSYWRRSASTAPRRNLPSSIDRSARASFYPQPNKLGHAAINSVFVSLAQVVGLDAQLSGAQYANA